MTEAEKLGKIIGLELAERKWILAYEVRDEIYGLASNHTNPKLIYETLLRAAEQIRGKYYREELETINSNKEGDQQMPLTKKGKKVIRAMRKQYGKKKGTQIFYASINSGKLKGMHQRLISNVIK